MGFENAFNKFARFGNTLNREANKIIGKEVFGEIKEMEPPKEFPPYNSFPEYTVPEPCQWQPQNGSEKTFTLQGYTISVSANFDVCMSYRKRFNESANYYTEKFRYKYQNCVSDYDTFVHYFPEIYQDCLNSMLQRAYSLLLPFGVFSESLENFTKRHVNTYMKAIETYGEIAMIEISHNQNAETTGNIVGNSIALRGGGFGIKGAAKGIATASAFNLGMNLLGKFVAQQKRLSQEEKSEIFNSINIETLLIQVQKDYENTFLTLMQTLSDGSVIERINTIPNEELVTMVNNIKNPMFPENRLAETLVNLISTYPFSSVCFELLESKIGKTNEVISIINYFQQA